MTVCARRSSRGSVFGRGFDSPRLHHLIGMRTPVRSHQCLTALFVLRSKLMTTIQRPEGKRTKRPMPRYAHGSWIYMARLSPTWTSAEPSSAAGLPQSPTMGGRLPGGIKIRATAQRKRRLWSRRCDILASYDLDPAQILLCAGSFLCVNLYHRYPLQPIQSP